MAGLTEKIDVIELLLNTIKEQTERIEQRIYQLECYAYIIENRNGE